MIIRPKHDYVLLLKYKKEEKKGVLIMPDERPRNVGIVEDFGGECEYDWNGGELVQYTGYAIPVEWEKDFILVKEENIIAVLDEE